LQVSEGRVGGVCPVRIGVQPAAGESSRRRIVSSASGSVKMDVQEWHMSWFSLGLKGQGVVAVVGGMGNGLGHGHGHGRRESKLKLPS
jgi:hypothetical protein